MRRMYTCCTYLNATAKQVHMYACSMRRKVKLVNMMYKNIFKTFDRIYGMRLVSTLFMEH